MSKKLRYYAYLFILILIVIYIVYLNKHNPSDSLYLSEENLATYMKAAEYNDTKSLKRLSEYYRFYIQDNNQTIAFLRKFSYLNNSYVESALIFHLLDSPEKDEAIALLEKRAKNGHKNSQRLLADFYKEGEYVDKNVSLAQYWQEKYDNDEK